MPRYTREVKTVRLEELGALAEDIRRGETVAVVHDDKTVARLVPEGSPEDAVDALVGQSLARRGSSEVFPEAFFTAPRPKAEQSVLEQVLDERRSNR